MRALALCLAVLLLPALLLAQDVPPTESGLSPIAAVAVAVLLPVLGFIAKLAYDGLKTIIPFYDKLPAVVHQAAAPLFGVLFGWATAAAGVPAITDLAGIDVNWLNGLLVAGVMAGIKRLDKAKNPVDATVALEASRASTGAPPFRG